MWRAPPGRAPGRGPRGRTPAPRRAAAAAAWGVRPWGARTRRRAGRSPGASAPARPRPAAARALPGWRRGRGPTPAVTSATSAGASGRRRPRSRSAAGCVPWPPPGCWQPGPAVPRCWSVSWLISSQGLVRPGALYAGGLACLVEPVIGGAPVHADVADERVRGAMPGRPLPRAAAVPARPAAGAGLVPEVTPAGRGRLLPEGFRGGHGLLRRGFVVEQRGDRGGGHDPAVARLRVDDPVLQVAARPDRREQGGQVVGEVFHGRRPLARPAQPVAERQAGRRRPWLAPRPAHAHDLGGQRVVHPYRAGIGVTVAAGVAGQRRGHRVRGRAGAARVKPGPDGLAGRLPPGRPSLPQR